MLDVHWYDNKCALLNIYFWSTRANKQILIDVHWYDDKCALLHIYFWSTRVNKQILKDNQITVLLKLIQNMKRKMEVSQMDIIDIEIWDSINEVILLFYYCILSLCIWLNIYVD